MKCRYDWHQTATHVTVAVYAKNYDHRSVKLQVSPVRLNFTTYFPQEAGSFDMDVELKGVRPSFAMLLYRIIVRIYQVFKRRLFLCL